MIKLLKKLNPIKKLSISTQLFINYIFLFIILILALIVTFTFGALHLDNELGEFDSDTEIILEDIEEFGVEKAFEISKLPEGSYIEILNSELIVIDQHKSIHDNGYKYSYIEFVKLGTDGSYQYQIFHDTGIENGDIVLIYNPKYPENENEALQLIKEIVILIITIFIVIVFLVLLIYSKFTSKTLVKPIQRILEGVKKISKGDYSTRINYNSKNELGYLINAINQMTQKIENEIALRERSENNRKRLILDISHDLKTPLTNVLGYSETLSLSNDLDNELKNKYIDIIISNSKKANNLLQDLFELSHIENDTPFLIEECDLSEFLREILIEYIPELEANNMSFDFDIPDEKILVKMHALKLERAISNIINNSIKYSGNNTTLRLKLKSLDDKVVLIIEDNGAGIPTDFAKDIFEPFVRLDVSRNSKTGGTGLGLGITKAIIEKHNGSIKLDTSYRDGCRFIISLPIIKDM